MSRYDGKTTRRRLKKLRLDEISIVDQPAQGPARVAILKRQADTGDVHPVEKRMAVTTLAAGHAHTIIMVRAGSDGMAEVRAGQTSYADGHVHDWIMDDAGNILLADAEGHTHGLAALVTKAEGTFNADQAQGVLAALLPVDPQASDNSAADDPGTIQKANIKMKPNDDAAKIPEAVQKQLDELTKTNERLTKVAALSPEARAHFDTLADDKADEWLGKTADEQAAFLKNRADADPVEYTTLDGVQIRKSQGAVVLSLAKSNDDLRRQVLASEAVAKRASLVKRASDELGHLVGNDEAKADLLGAVESLPVEKRGPVLEILKSKDAGMAKAFAEIGTSDSGNGVDAQSKIETIAKRLREASPNLTPEQAYVKALETPEGRELHSQLVG